MHDITIKEGLDKELIDDFFQVTKFVYSETSFNRKIPEDHIYKEFHENDPYFNHGEKTILIAYDSNANPIARVVLFFDKDNKDFIEKSSGYFSYFDSVNNSRVVNKLFKQANQWFHEKGIKHMYGPMSTKITDPRGVLMQGYDIHPAVGMSYNNEYYSDLFEKDSFLKAMDLYEYVTKITPPYKRLSIIKKVVSKKLLNATIRYIDLDNIEIELEKIVDLYNLAWKENWGFTPIILKELMYSAEELLPFLKLSRIIEMDNKIIAFYLIIPDLNYLHCSNNEINIDNIDRYRIYFIGVHPEYKKYGVTALLVDDLLNNIGLHHNIQIYNVGWMLENNKKALNISFSLGGKSNIVTKIYRIYKKEIQS